MKKSLLTVLLLACLSMQAQEVNIIPRPLDISLGTGKFFLTAKTRIFVSGKETKGASFLNSYLKHYYGLTLPVVFMKKKLDNPQDRNSIYLAYKNGGTVSPGRYELNIGKAIIGITGDETAVFYGIQSLIQLLPLAKTGSLGIQTVNIVDSPRFSYRGMHLDVGRHFFPVAFVKKYIDFIAMHKMNTFHWHLTEDQGWRIEIKKYPKLTSVGGFRNGTIIGHHPGTGNDHKRDGGFYTQEQIKEVVKYAADRYITIIPEIELPGHSSAAIAAYPQLSCFPEESTKPAKGSVWSRPAQGKFVQQAWGVYDDVFAPTEYTFGFLQDVLDEVLALFPSKYIHIGGDECPKDAWKRSVFCQQLIKEKGLKDEHGLQSYFIQRIEKYLNGKGRQIIGWDEILEGGLAPNATVMSWRGEKGGIEAAKQKHPVIMTPGGWMYFDHSQTKKEDSLTIGGFTTVQKVYSYEPVPAELGPQETSYILGAQANLWSEYISNPAKAEYMLFPRMSALSEVLWTARERKDWSGFEKRLLFQFRRYDWMGVNYSKAYFQRPE